MTIDPETLMAYADGELGPIETKRVEQAIAADSTLDEQVKRHRALTASLRDAFAPLDKAPPPAQVAAMLRESVKVVPMAPRSASRERTFWIGAVAASLIAGLFAAPLVAPQNDVAIEGGRAIARGEIAHALNTQLAATQAGDAATRIGVTFRDRGERLCRTFERGGTGGIACAEGKEWSIERLYGGLARQGGQYRQAGSPAAAMMADAQAMMAGGPLNAAGEAAAVAGRSH
jgi:hypothetical protein